MVLGASQAAPLADPVTGAAVTTASEEALVQADVAAPAELDAGSAAAASEIATMDLPTAPMRLAAPVQLAALTPALSARSMAPITGADLELTLDVLEDIEALPL